WRDLTDGHDICERRGEALHGFDRLRQLHPSYDALGAARLVGTEQRPQRTKSTWIGKGAEHERSQRAFTERTTVPALNGRSRRLDQPVVLNAARTSRDARHASETLVEVAHHGVVERCSLTLLLHEINAPPRRVHLLAP